MSMINKVRETVLSILNKNNYGYVSPIDFNLFAKQAQLDLFEDYFYYINKTVNAENARLAGAGHADIARQTNEVIDTFTQYRSLALIAGSDQTFTLPDDWYTLVNVQWGLKNAEGDTELENEAERVSEYNIRRLLKSNITAPSKQFPAYIFSQMGFPNTEGPGTGTLGDLGNQITIYPVADAGKSLGCSVTYVRYPKEPNWTYSTLVDPITGLATGEAFFNQSVGTYQDFEVPESDSTDLVYKILQYAGMSIREVMAVQFGEAGENEEEQDQGLFPPARSASKGNIRT